MKRGQLEPFELEDKEELDASELLMTIDSLYNLDSEQAAVPVSADSGENLIYSERWMEEKGFREEQIDEIKRGIQEKLPVEHYAKECYNWMQMREIRRGLAENLQTELYENEYFDAEQMHEIRLGLLKGVDVSSYARLVYTAIDMAKMRKKLLQDEYNVNPQGFAMERVDEEIGVKMRITDDCMEAYVTLLQDTDISVRRLKKFLERNDVTYGLLNKQLSAVLEKKRIGEEIKVAEGERAKEGKDGWFEFHFNPLLPGKPREMDDGSVDYTEIVEADKISSGDMLAKYHPAVPGKNGKTVTGITIQGKPGRELPPLSGKGFVVNREKDTYTATTDGFVLADQERGTLNVWNIFVVQGDVNRYNGHISYDGIIHIKGSVGDMAMIEASGNIVVEGMVESAQLIAGENVILKGGVNGGERGLIKAGRKVMGKFFEAVSVYANGDIEGNYFMNCFAQTDGRIIAKGKKGRIMGGNLQALGGVEAVNIGNYGSAKTIIDAGNPNRTEDRRRQVYAKMSKVQDELYQLEVGKNKLEQMLGERLKSSNDLFKKTCYAIDVKEEQKQALEEMLEHLNELNKRALKAQILVHGKLDEGVRIIVCGRQKRVEQAIVGRTVIKGE